MTEEITYRHGLLLRKGGLVFALILFIFAIGILNDHKMPGKFFISPSLIILGILCLSTTGVRFDLKNRTVSNYILVFGFTNGKKIPLHEFSNLTIIKQNYSIQSISKTGSEINSSHSTYNLLLTNKNFFKKIVIKQFDSFHDAEREGRDLSKYLNIDLVKYNPPVITRRKK